MKHREVGLVEGAAYAKAHAEGTILSIRAQPGARRNTIVGPFGSALKVAVIASADQGRANTALLELLCRRLGVGANSVRLLKGDKSRDKAVLVLGLSPEEVVARIET